MKRKTLLMLVLLSNIAFMNLMTPGQNPLSSKDVEKAFKIVLSGGNAQRTIDNTDFIYVRWKKGKLNPEVHVLKYDSAEIAKKEFRLQNELVDEALNGLGQKDLLIGAGDEGVIYSKIGLMGEVGLSFRRTKYCVEIDSLPLEQAMNLAKRLDKLLTTQ